MQYHFILPAIMVAMALSGCVHSKDPVFGPDSRVLPFAFPATFEGYGRATPNEPWVGGARVTLVADADRVVREVDEAGAPRATTFTFHALAPQRFLVQGNTGNVHVYGVLELHEGEAIGTTFECALLDQQAFRAAGGTIEPSGQFQSQICWLNSVSEPAKLLASIAERPAGLQSRLVPVR